MMRSLFLTAAVLAASLPCAALARPVVAIIDSGVARTAELQPVLIAEYDMGAHAARPAFHPRYDHGTMVATILNREARGGIGIISLRIDDPAGCPVGKAPPCQPYAAPIVAAIDKATSLNVDAINLSLALADDRSIVDAVRRATAKGITVVMAAGNEGWDHPSNLAMARAGFPATVLVGALDAEGRPWAGSNRPDAGGLSDYSYVWRRGVDVPTANAQGLAITGTGTSFAAPTETARRVLIKTAAPISQEVAQRHTGSALQSRGG